MHIKSLQYYHKRYDLVLLHVALCITKYSIYHSYFGIWILSKHSFGRYVLVQMIEINKADLGELDVEVVPVQFSFSSKESCVLANPVPVQCQKYCT